jgi:MoxR-like ATPase
MARKKSASKSKVKEKVSVVKSKGSHSDGGAVAGKSVKKPSMAKVQKVHDVIASMRKEVSKAIVGQEEIVDSLIRALLCDGHVLLEGVPGVAKTLAIKTLAVVSGCESKRVQFTVDLLPTDITGITSYTPGKGFETIKGPIFANFLIADEINRSPPKTQSALIEGMQEKQVTIGKETFKLPSPFFVMATENPLEQSGVYTLPEAQVDRFLFKVIMGYPEYEEEEKIIEDNMTLMDFADFGIKAITNPTGIKQMQELTKDIYLSKKIKKYILDIVTKTRTKDFEHGELIEWGGSPRAGIALFIAAKAKALMSGRNYVIPSDVKAVSHEILRHRIILSYRARAEKVDSDKIINQILNHEVKLG